ncbi:MAG: hypothetical protein AB7U20_22985 [Planctomycetaceae bacterium]
MNVVPVDPPLKHRRHGRWPELCQVTGEVAQSCNSRSWERRISSVVNRGGASAGGRGRFLLRWHLFRFRRMLEWLARQTQLHLHGTEPYAIEWEP